MNVTWGQAHAWLIEEYHIARKRYECLKALVEHFCPRCNGTGTMRTRIEPDDIDERTCTSCGGTGTRKLVDTK
jgi:DnaJ-class molecular chaperone